MKANRVVAVAAGSLLALSVAGGVAAASGGGSSSGGSSTTTVQQDSAGSDNETPGENAVPEGAADQAAQDAACTAAGIDPTASNIQYDDATGVCTLDAGGDNGSDTAAEEGGGNESQADSYTATEEGGGNESQADSDGPGGHQDPAGDVNHEFDGEE